MLKVIASLAVALLLSLGVNLLQWRAAAVAVADREAALTLGEERGRRLAADEAVGRASLVATLAQSDNLLLIAELHRIAQAGRERVTVYRERVGALPAPDCAPGADRMAAVNALVEASP
jgi:hypothetical protein